MFAKKLQHQKGFTLMEVVVSVGIFVILITAVVQIYILIISQIASYREQTEISSLAQQYIEIARNLPYNAIGTLEGNPHGDLADLPNVINVTFGTNVYNIYYAVSYVDDPSDGTILAGTDPAPNDYKQIKLYIENVQKNKTSNFLTNIAPKGLEGLASGGAIYISVINANGEAVADATIQITNTSLSPNIDVTRKSDENGKWIEVALPVSASSYHIKVSKNGYSSDQTYPISTENPNPIKEDSTVLNGQVTLVSFGIDQLSSLTFKTLDQSCEVVSGVSLNIVGSKKIGTTPDIFKFNNSYTSNSSGLISLLDLEWDTYSPELNGNDYMIYGSYPIQQVSILPATQQNFTLIVGNKTANSLLTIVKDSTTLNPIEGASVQLQAMSLPNTFTITSLANANGQISSPGVNTVNNGTNKTFNITANSGFSIKDVAIDGVSFGAISNYTFENVSENHSIVASFFSNTGWLSGFGYRKKITISNANVNSNLENFPVLVNIVADSNMSSALANGHDISFTDLDGSSILNYERQSWSGGNGSAVTASFWVKVPIVSYENSTSIYIYYGKAGAEDGQNISETWDENYKGIWHLEDSASNKTVVDSTGVSNGTSSANTSTKSVVGKINKALTFNGTSDYVNFNTNIGAFTTNSNFTISAWVNSSLDSTDDVIYGNTENGQGYHLGINSSKKARFILYKDRNNYKGIDSSVLTSGWHQITGVWTGTAAKIFIDGQENSATAVSRGTVSSITTTTSTKIGLDTTSGGHYFKGPIDDVRVSDLIRSADWIHFEYHNILDVGNNLTFENQEEFLPVYTITTSTEIGGFINFSGEVQVEKGSNQTFIITTKTGYEMTDLLVDGTSVGINNTYTFNNITANHTISAKFILNTSLFSTIATKFTGGSVQSQQSWISGSGQENFYDINKYFFDDGGISVDIIPTALRLKKMGEVYVNSGVLTSSTFDTKTDQTFYTTLTFDPASQDASTNLKFQLATNNDNITWDYYGPDGTSNTYYEVSGTTINSLNNNKRYIRYKAFLSTTDSYKTPVLTSININYVSGCFTPGQVMFSNLNSSNRYITIVSMPGYQTKIIPDLNIQTNNILSILLGR